MKTVVDDAIDWINKATDTTCNMRKQELERFCEALQVESLMTDLDNFSGQAQRIQHEILNGVVQDGVVASRTIPIDDDDPARLRGNS